ncbi:MAG: CBS domain-containing protein [Haloferacaceae archaeon]
MEDIFVARVMSTDLHTVVPGTPLSEAAGVMLDNEIGSVLVVEDDDLVGIVTTTDFVRLVANGEITGAPVEAAMTTDIATAGPQESIRDAADRMMEHGVHHLPVVDESAGIVGMITTTDLASYLSHVETPSPL